MLKFFSFFLPFGFFILGKTKKSPADGGTVNTKSVAENTAANSEAKSSGITRLAIPSIAQGMYIRFYARQAFRLEWPHSSRQWLLRQIFTALSLLSMRTYADLSAEDVSILTHKWMFVKSLALFPCAWLALWVALGREIKVDNALNGLSQSGAGV